MSQQSVIKFNCNVNYIIRWITFADQPDYGVSYKIIGFEQQNQEVKR